MNKNGHEPEKTVRTRWKRCPHRLRNVKPGAAMQRSRGGMGLKCGNPQGRRRRCDRNRPKPWQARAISEIEGRRLSSQAGDRRILKERKSDTSECSRIVMYDDFSHEAMRFDGASRGRIAVGQREMPVWSAQRTCNALNHGWQSFWGASRAPQILPHAERPCRASPLISEPAIWFSLNLKAGDFRDPVYLPGCRPLRRG